MALQYSPQGHDSVAFFRRKLVIPLWTGINDRTIVNIYPWLGFHWLIHSFMKYNKITYNKIKWNYHIEVVENKKNVNKRAWEKAQGSETHSSLHTGMPLQHQPGGYNTYTEPLLETQADPVHSASVSVSSHKLRSCWFRWHYFPSFLLSLTLHLLFRRLS